METANRSQPPALVVGTAFGCRVHVPALRAAGFEVAGLVGTHAERTKRRADANGIPQVFTDLDEAITRTAAKLVTIATPPLTHGPLVLNAISRGCHVLCEKPFASDTVEARALLQAAQCAGVVHALGHQFRWSPERAILARTIAQGLIGEPRLATLVQYLSLVASPEAKMPSWWFDRDAEGGWLGASGSHLVDQVRTMLGEFASLSAALPIVSDRKDVAEDSYVIRFQMANRVEGVLQQTAAAWGPGSSMTSVAGTQGTVWIEAGAVKIADRNGTRELPVPADLILPEPVQFAPYTRLCEALRAAMDGRAATSAVPMPTFVDGVACMEVLDAIRRSAANKGELVVVR